VGCPQDLLDDRSLIHYRPGSNTGANGWFLWSTPIQMPPQRGGIRGRLAQDLPSTRLQSGADRRCQKQNLFTLRTSVYYPPSLTVGPIRLFSPCVFRFARRLFFCSENEAVNPESTFAEGRIRPSVKAKPTSEIDRIGPTVRVTRSCPHFLANKCDPPNSVEKYYPHFSAGSSSAAP